MKLESFIPGVLLDLMIARTEGLPNNHRALLELMLVHANENPSIEVGGILLTDQKKNIQHILRVTGEKHRVKTPLPKLQELARYTNWNTLVKYHVHLPPPIILAHLDVGPSPEDQIKWYRWVDILGSNDYGSLAIASLYNYVVRADGRFSVQKG